GRDHRARARSLPLRREAHGDHRGKGREVARIDGTKPMSTKALSLTRPQKAAAILVAMGKPSAGRLLKFFKPEELKALMEAARSLKTIPQSELEKIVAEFEDEFAEGAGLLDSN